MRTALKLFVAAFSFVFVFYFLVLIFSLAAAPVSEALVVIHHPAIAGVVVYLPFLVALLPAVHATKKAWHAETARQNKRSVKSKNI